MGQIGLALAQLTDPPYGKHLPLDPNWNDNTTTNQLMKNKDFTGKNVVITGCTSGIGKEFGRVFYKHNANILMVIRNDEKGTLVQKEWKKSYPKSMGKTHKFICDINELDQVKVAVDELEKFIGKDKIDILLLNALQYFENPLKFNKDGQEIQFAGSLYTGHYMVCKLLPYMNENRGRIIQTTSGASKMIQSVYPHGPKFYDLNYEQEIGKNKIMSYLEQYKPYGLSKFAINCAFYYYDINIRKQKGKENIAFFPCAPGPTNTPGSKRLYTKIIPYLLIKVFGRIFLGIKIAKVEVGTANVVVGAIDDRFMTKKYRGKMMQWKGVGKSHVKQYSKQICKKIVEHAEKVTGIKYPYTEKEETDNNITVKAIYPLLYADNDIK